MGKIAVWRDIVAASIFMVPVVALWAGVLFFTEGHFTYSLDDPYIHLALADNILHGNYGINPDEPSAPSSSILWPYLLAPFAVLGSLFEYVPLFVNIVCLLLSGVMLIRLLPGVPWFGAVILALGLMFSLNLYGLVFTGMEHSLQILLVLVIVGGLCKQDTIQTHAKMRFVFYLCLLLLPLVRYEGLAISVPVLAYRFFSGDWKPALVTSLLLVSALAGFSLYLHSLGLGYLPSSVLSKSSHADTGSALDNLVYNVRFFGFLIVPAALLALFHIRRDPFFSVMIMTTTLLHFVFGKFGWFGRYEVYFVIFLVMLCLQPLLGAAPRMGLVVLALPFAFTSLVAATARTPMAAANIQFQQGQMANIVQRLDGKVAVNDLGLVALRSSHYVLDLWGLGSVEALRNRMENGNSADWIHRMMSQKEVEYAVIYDDWFPHKPDNWVKVADLKMSRPPVSTASDVVGFFAVSEESAARLKAVLTRYAAEQSSVAFSLVFKPASHAASDKHP